MTAQSHRYATVRCDGCGVVFGEPGQHPEVADVRRAARAAGWQLVPKRLANGGPARVDSSNLGRAGMNASDVCPPCVDTFTPVALNRARSAGGGYFRGVTDRLKALEAENAALRAGQRQ